MFVNFDHERARAAFARFERHCRELGVQARYDVSLRFAGVDITDRNALGRVLAEGIARAPAAIVAPNSIVATEAVRRTTTVPIIFGTHQDPVELQWTRSLVERRANLTGISFHLDLEAKMLELLREASPRSRTIGYVGDSLAMTPRVRSFMRAAAEQHRLQWAVAAVGGMATLAKDIAVAGPVDAWIVGKVVALEEEPDGFIRILNETRRPAIYPSQREAEAGAPMAYEAVFEEPLAAIARQLGRVLSGVRPADIPIERPARFRLTINIASARRAGMRLSPELLSRADRVI